VLLRENSTNAYISYQFSLPKAYHRPDHSIHIVEYYRDELLLLSINMSSPRLEPTAVFGFVTLVPVISSPKPTILFFAPFLYLA
jgi:hypothetical protein